MGLVGETKTITSSLWAPKKIRNVKDDANYHASNA